METLLILVIALVVCIGWRKYDQYATAWRLSKCQRHSAGLLHSTRRTSTPKA